MSWTDADVVSSSAPAWGDADVVEAPKPRTFTESLGRQVGLTGRAAANIIASPVTIGGNALNKAINALTGSKLGMPSETIERGLDAVFPTPETGIEKFGQGMAQSAPAMALPAGMLPQILGNAAISSAQAPEGKEAEGAAVGGVVGAGGQILSRTLGGLIEPTASALRLMKDKVKLTAGQMQGGALGKFETELAKTPIFGVPMRNRIGESRAGWERSIMNDVLPPGTSTAGIKSISNIHEAFDQAYGDALTKAAFPSGASPVLPTSKLIIDSKQAVPAATPDQLQKAHSFIENLMENNGLPHTPATLQAVESKLKAEVGKYKFGNSPEGNTYGELLDEVATNMRNQWRGALPEAKRAELSAIDAQYRKFLPVQNASKKGDAALTGAESGGDEVLLAPGDFTPKSLLRELRAGDKTGRKSQWFAGERPLQESATVAERVLGSDAIRASSLSHALRAAAGGAAYTGAGALPTAAALGGLTAYGSKPVQGALTSRFARGDYPIQKVLADLLRKSSPAVADAINEE